MTDQVKPNVSILISGPSRTGKTTAANLLAERYGIRNIKIGELFRELTHIDNAKFVDRPEALDREMDEKQAHMIRTATPDDPFILEARLAAFLASKERQKQELPVVTVLFWAPERVRMERQLKKALRDDPDATVTLEELLQGERIREAGDRALWRKVHPELDDSNVFDPAFADEHGRPVYDLIVDTRMGRPDTCADYVHDWLVERGAFRDADS